MSDAGGLLAVLVLVAANGFFVAAEFSLVAVRRSRVIELAASGRMNAAALVRALDSLDSNLAATQLGITISSLALGWIGEPAIAHLIEQPLAEIWGTRAGISAYAIAVGISFGSLFRTIRRGVTSVAREPMSGAELAATFENL